MYQSMLKVFPHHTYVDFMPIQYGWASCPPHHRNGPTRNDHYILHFITKGRGSFAVHKHLDTQSLRFGQAFLSLPDQTIFYQADDREPWDYYWIEFTGFKAKEMMQSLGLSSYQQIYEADLKAASPKEIAAPIEELLTSSSEQPIYILQKIYQFFTHLDLYSAHPVHYQEKLTINQHLQYAINFIHHHFQENVTVETIANYVNLTPHHLTRLFKQQMNTTPSEYLIHYRLQHAADLLKTSDKSIRDIAEASGYANQYYFSQAFKKHFGQPPSIWRKH